MNALQSVKINLRGTTGCCSCTAKGTCLFHTRVEIIKQTYPKARAAISAGSKTKVREG